MANELEQLTINEAGTGWVDSSPDAVSTGYQAQNTNIMARTVGQDLTNVYVSGDDVMVDISGPVDVDGIPFSVTSEITLTPSDEDDGSGVYYIRIIDGSATTTKTLELTNDEITWSAVKNAYYDDDGNRVLNWKVDYETYGEGVTVVKMIYAGDGNVSIEGAAEFGGNVSGKSLLGDVVRHFPIMIDGEGSLSVGSVKPALAALGNDRVVLANASNNTLRTYDFDGTDWAQVGNAFAVDIKWPALAAMSSTRIAFIDNASSTLRTYDFDGTDWSQVGNGISISSVGYPALAALSGTRVAFVDSVNEALRTYDFDGTDWAKVGNGISVSGLGEPALAAISSSRVLFLDDINLALRTYSFTGSDWVLLDGREDLSSCASPAITVLSPTELLIANGADDLVSHYEYSGGSFSASGLTYSPSGGIGNPAIAAMSKERVAYIDDEDDDLRALSFTYDEFPPAPVFDLY